MEDIHVANAKKNVAKAGFLDIEIDPTLDLFSEIERLKKEKNAILLAHYYQEPDIQDVRITLGIVWGWRKKPKRRMRISSFLPACISWLKLPRS